MTTCRPRTFARPSSRPFLQFNAELEHSGRRSSGIELELRWGAVTMPVRMFAAGGQGRTAQNKTE